MNKFQELNSQIDMHDIVRYLGIDERRGYILCPFHSDSRPSMKVYKHNCYCFSCNKRADSIDLVSGVKGISVKEAFSELNSYFSLGIVANSESKENLKQVSNVSLCKQIKKLCCDTLADLLRYLASIGYDDSEYMHESALYKHVESMHDTLLEASTNGLNDVFRSFGGVNYFLKEMGCISNEIVKFKEIRNSRRS